MNIPLKTPVEWIWGGKGLPENVLSGTVRLENRFILLLVGLLFTSRITRSRANRPHTGTGSASAAQNESLLTVLPATGASMCHVRPSGASSVATDEMTKNGSLQKSRSLQ